MCVRVVCEQVVCEQVVCVRVVCVRVVCEQVVCEQVAAGRREEEKERTGVHSQNQEPHTKMWGKTFFFLNEY